jgi:hypothetical protein
LSRRNAAQIVTLSFVFAIVAAVLANRHVIADDWLPVPPADLALKDNPAEPGADAMILYRNSHVDARRASIDGEFVTEYIRIKIFTQKGADQESSPQIDFVKGESEIRDIGARTIKPDGTVVNFDGKVYETLVSKSGRSKSLEKTFTLPQVQPGCVIEYKYRETYRPEYVYEQSWTLSEHLFTRDAFFSIAPYAARDSLDPTLYFRTTNLAHGLLPARQGDGSYKMEVHNLPGVAEESLMPPPRAIQARVEFFYRDAGNAATQTTEQYWNDVGKIRSGDIDKFLNKKGALTQAVSETVAASDTPEQKLHKLYDRVQKIPNLSYQDEKTAAELKTENIKPNKDVEDVLKHNFATAYQVNILLVGLARTAGFDADMVYIAARDRGVFTPAGQATNQLDDFIVWVRAGDKEYWLDPASRYYPFGLLPWNETEANGIRASKNGAEFVKTPAQKSGDSTVTRNLDLDLKDDGGASGTFDVSFGGVAGAMQRSSIFEDDDAGRKKAIETELKSDLPKGAELDVQQIADWDDTAKPLRVTGTITFATFGSAAGHRLLVPVTAFLGTYREAFQPEKRVNQICFGERSEEIDSVTMRAPAGFAIEATPDAKRMVAATSFSYSVEPAQHGQTLTVKRKLVINDLNFPATEYAALRHFMLGVQTNDEAQAVMTTTAGDAKPATASAAAPAKN